MLLVSAALIAAGCAGFRPTPYQPAIDGGYGYSEKQLGADEYRITVTGNAATPAAVLIDQLFYRAAEIALGNGHEHFYMARNAGGRQFYIKPAFLMPQFGLGPGAGGVRTPLLRYEGLPVGVEPSRQLIATATVILGTVMPSRAGEVFDAATVKDHLRAEMLPPGQ